MRVRGTLSLTLCAGSVLLGGWKESPGRLSIPRAALRMGLPVISFVKEGGSAEVERRERGMPGTEKLLEEGLGPRAVDGTLGVLCLEGADDARSQRGFWESLDGEDSASDYCSPCLGLSLLGLEVVLQPSHFRCLLKGENNGVGREY